MEVLRTGAKRKLTPYSELFGSRQMSRRSRCSVIVAHPNDEIVGGGCLISKLANVQVLHVSTGVPPTAQPGQDASESAGDAEARSRDCLSALALAHVPSDRVVEFGLPRLEAPYRMADLTRRLLIFLTHSAPKIILTHAYEGGHPDHDAVAFSVHSAVGLLRKHGLKPPVIFEMAIYPGHNGTVKVPEFLHSPARESTTLMLDENSKALKKQMFSCFKTQEDTLKESPLGPEKFRLAPKYDFTQPPHDGELHYETLDWGITGEQWRALARKALTELFA